MNPEEIKRIRAKLNSIGQGFCMAKWYHVSMHLHTGVNHSCYHPMPHPIPLEEVKKNPSKLHNTDWKKQQRKIMLEGGRPDECSYCWNIEDLEGDQISDRYLRSSEDWATPLIDKTAQMTGSEDVYPRYLEVNFGFECNLKCSYCASSVSSSWHAEIKKHGDYDLKNPVNKRQYSVSDQVWKREDENPYIEAFWKWFPEVYPHLHTFRVTGGEPLLSSNVFKSLDYISENPNPNLEWSVNTNMCISEKNLKRYTDRVTDLVNGNKIKQVSTFTSVDTWGPQAEYIRHGFKRELFLTNIDTYLRTVPKSTINFMITFNFLSMCNFDLLLDKILDLRSKYNTEGIQRVNFDTPYLIEPPHLSAQITDDKMIDRMYTTLDYMQSHCNDETVFAFTETEYKKLERVVKWIERFRYTGDELELNRQDFCRFVDQHDKRRRTDFLNTFPELVDFYRENKPTDV